MDNEVVRLPEAVADAVELSVGPLERLDDQLFALVPGVLGALGIFLALWLVGGLVGLVVEKGARRMRKRRSLGIALSRLVRWGIVLGGLLVAITIAFPSFSPGDLVQLLGITSVAIGFAFRDILQNFLAGVLLLVREPFREGDQIIHGTFEGTVEEVQTRATTLRTYDGRRVVVPNAKIFTDVVVVNTAFEARRMEQDIRVGYGDDLEEARRAIAEGLAKAPSVNAAPPPEVFLVELADSAARFRARWWFDPPRKHDEFETLDAVLTSVARSLRAHGLELPVRAEHVVYGAPDRTASSAPARPAPRRARRRT